MYKPPMTNRINCLAALTLASLASAGTGKAKLQM
jgi:hypothetical protein